MTRATRDHRVTSARAESDRKHRRAPRATTLARRRPAGQPDTALPGRELDASDKP